MKEYAVDIDICLTLPCLFEAEDEDNLANKIISYGAVNILNDFDLDISAIKEAEITSWDAEEI